MPVGPLKEIGSQCPPRARLLGLDIGKTTIGLAVSDSGWTLATPLQTVKRTKFTQDIQELAKVIREYEIGGYVLGWPVNMDGSEGPSCDRVRAFADEMTKHPGIFGADPWVALWDERLSTVSVESFVDEFVEKRATRRGAKDSGLIDKLAAQVILQGAVDYLQK
ncbi:MAG: Holliday junction resolvase RuvX [Rhodospirillales bacterium]|nr:Holliday junction resolvase RuvX [Rhodospirillales bacterium]